MLLGTLWRFQAVSSGRKTAAEIEDLFKIHRATVSGFISQPQGLRVRAGTSRYVAKPLLSASFETTALGLHAIGVPAAPTFGPR